MRERVKKALILLAVGVVVNITLAFVKLYVGLSSNSLTIMLDAINSFFDIITCAVTVVAFGILMRPRSEYVPHGYGRSEYLASFVVAAVSAVVGGLFFIRSLNRMAMPEPVWFGAESCALISAAIPIKLAMGLFYHFANKKMHSKAIEAIALDSFLDTAITSASLIAFVISSEVDYAVDAIFGMALSIVVIIFAVKMIWDSIKSVVVGDVSQSEVERLKQEAGKLPCVESVRSACIHDYGYGEKVATICVRVKRGVSFEEFDAQRREFVQNILSLEEDGRPTELQLVPLLCSDEDDVEEADDIVAQEANAPQVDENPDGTVEACAEGENCKDNNIPS